MSKQSVEQAGFLVDDDGSLIGTGSRAVPCGCPECSDGVQLEHFACETVTPALSRLEQRGDIIRAYDGGAWRWFVVA